MKKQIIFIVLICLLVLPTLVNADSDLIFTRGSGVDLKIPCVFEDVAYCDNQATCNITINYPNGTNLVNNDAMTYNEAYFNYTLTRSQTRVLGSYAVTMICEDKGAVGFESFTFEMTSTGLDNEGVMNYVFFGALLVAFILLIIGLSKEDLIFTALSSFIFIISGAIIYFYPLGYLPSLINTGLAFVLWGAGAYILIKSGIEMLEGY